MDFHTLPTRPTGLRRGTGDSQPPPPQALAPARTIPQPRVRWLLTSSGGCVQRYCSILDHRDTIRERHTHSTMRGGSEATAHSAQESRLLTSAPVSAIWEVFQTPTASVQMSIPNTHRPPNRGWRVFYRLTPRSLLLTIRLLSWLYSDWASLKTFYHRPVELP